MNEIVKGFQTQTGVKLYDYDSLANKPDLSVYVPTTDITSSPTANKVLRLNKDGILPADVSGKAGSVDWPNIAGRPDSLDGYGLSNEVYTKDKVYTKDQIDSMIGDLGSSGVNISQALINHNNSETAHEYIRGLITELSNRLNTIADSDDETLDQISELVTYIKDNRDLISQITTKKVNKTDIINDLVSNITDKPLSAAQGAVLRAMIEAIVIPTKLSELQEDVNHRTVTDAEKAAWNEPDIEVDTTLEQSGMAADAKAVGDALKQKQPIGDYALKSAIPTQLSQLQSDENHRTVTDAEKAAWNEPSIEVDETLTQVGMAADAQAVGQKIEQIKVIAQNEAPSNLQGLWVDLDDNSNDGNLIDETLTQSGMAADAGEVGRRLNNLPIPSKLSDLQEDVGHRTVTDAEKEKLAGIDTGANKTVVDSSLSSTSTNPVQNKVVNQAIQNLDNKIGKSSVAEQMAVKQDKHIPLSITLTASGWSNNLQTVIANGVTTNSTVIVTSAPQNWLLYQEANIYCSQQMENSLTFTCETIPSSNLIANVVILS